MTPIMEVPVSKNNANLHKITVFTTVKIKITGNSGENVLNGFCKVLFWK
ncbi:MAG: hypothetical protein J6U22_11905 [Bacteroidaceae bacterium]|nr:hypothetical protein [Bacteroidaceae bacterium]